MNDSKSYIYGRNAVAEAISSESPIEKIYVHFGATGNAIEKVIYLARKAKIPVVKYDKQKFGELEKKITSEPMKTQGIIALKTLVRYYDIDEIVKLSFKRDSNPVLVLLNEINDVHNLGAIARSAECSGASGLIIPERNSSPVTPAAVKTSAGALEHIPIAKTGSVINTLVKLKEKGFWIISTDMDGKNNYYDERYDKPVVIVIGNEGKGISSAILKHSDITIKIPMKGKINSLNASVSAGIILFEILKQRSIKK